MKEEAVAEMVLTKQRDNPSIKQETTELLAAMLVSAPAVGAAMGAAAAAHAPAPAPAPAPPPAPAPAPAPLPAVPAATECAHPACSLRVPKGRASVFCGGRACPAKGSRKRARASGLVYKCKVCGLPKKGHTCGGVWLGKPTQPSEAPMAETGLHGLPAGGRKKSVPDPQPQLEDGCPLALIVGSAQPPPDPAAQPASQPAEPAVHEEPEKWTVESGVNESSVAAKKSSANEDAGRNASATGERIQLGGQREAAARRPPPQDEEPARPNRPSRVRKKRAPPSGAAAGRPPAGKKRRVKVYGPSELVGEGAPVADGKEYSMESMAGFTGPGLRAICSAQEGKRLSKKITDKETLKRRVLKNQARLVPRGTPLYGPSKFVGVSRDRQKWRAQVWHAGQLHFLGMFNAEETAARAYDDEKRRLCGSQAVAGPLNFPTEAEQDALSRASLAEQPRRLPRSYVNGPSVRWSAAEEQLLRNLVQTHGATDWEAKAEHFERRTAKMLENKWFNNLRKQPGLKVPAQQKKFSSQHRGVSKGSERRTWNVKIQRKGLRWTKRGYKTEDAAKEVNTTACKRLVSLLCVFII